MIKISNEVAVKDISGDCGWLSEGLTGMKASGSQVVHLYGCWWKALVP